jgi:hypothetical protein
VRGEGAGSERSSLMMIDRSCLVVKSTLREQVLVIAATMNDMLELPEVLLYEFYLLSW